MNTSTVVPVQVGGTALSKDSATVPSVEWRCLKTVPHLQIIEKKMIIFFSTSDALYRGKIIEISNT